MILASSYLIKNQSYKVKKLKTIPTTTKHYEKINYLDFKIQFFEIIDFYCHKTFTRESK